MPSTSRGTMSETVQLAVGDAAPAFTAADEDGNQHDLQAYLDNGKTVIIYFYPITLFS